MAKIQMASLIGNPWCISEAIWEILNSGLHSCQWPPEPTYSVPAKHISNQAEQNDTPAFNEHQQETLQHGGPGSQCVGCSGQETRLIRLYIVVIGKNRSLNRLTLIDSQRNRAELKLVDQGKIADLRFVGLLLMGQPVFFSVVRIAQFLLPPVHGLVHAAVIRPVALAGLGSGQALEGYVI